jgi:hypothetical protein
MDGVKLREVSMYDIENDRRSYRWDALANGKQVMVCGFDVKPGELEQWRDRARRMLASATDSLPLLKGCTYI